VNLFGDPDRRIVGAMSLLVMAVSLVVTIVGWRAGWPKVIWSVASGVLWLGIAGSYYARRMRSGQIVWACCLGALFLTYSWFVG